MKFFTRFNPPASKGLKCGPSRTKQEFAQEADIHFILKKYETTGFLVDPNIPNRRRPVFGDFTDVPNLQQAYDKMLLAQEQFDSLPSDLRRRFHWDPAELIEFCMDEKNRAEAVSLGLIAKTVEELKETTKSGGAAVAVSEAQE